MAKFREYRERKKKMRKFSIIAIAISVLVIIDCILPIPPFTMANIGFRISLFVLFPSLAVWFYTYFEPSERLISQLAQKYNGYILATFLIAEFDLKIETAEAIMERLFLKGYLDIENKVDNSTPVSQWITKFVGAASNQRHSHASEPRSTNMDLAAHTVDNSEMSVSEINDMLLGGGLHLGDSGQPT